MNKCLRFAKIIKTQLIFSQIASAAEFQNEAINNDKFASTYIIHNCKNKNPHKFSLVSSCTINHLQINQKNVTKKFDLS